MKPVMAYAFCVTVLTRNRREGRKLATMLRSRLLEYGTGTARAPMVVAVDYVDAYQPEPGDFDLATLEGERDG